MWSLIVCSLWTNVTEWVFLLDKIETMIPQSAKSKSDKNTNNNLFPQSITLLNNGQPGWRECLVIVSHCIVSSLRNVWIRSQQRIPQFQKLLFVDLCHQILLTFHHWHEWQNIIKSCILCIDNRIIALDSSLYLKIRWLQHFTSWPFSYPF